MLSLLCVWGHTSEDAFRPLGLSGFYSGLIQLFLFLFCSCALIYLVD